MCEQRRSGTGIGDVKDLISHHPTHSRHSRASSGKRRVDILWKLCCLLGALLLTWGVLHLVLSAIFSARSTQL